MNHHQLEWWAFVWSEARLLIAAVALFIGGVPPLVFAFPDAGVLMLLKPAWIISGVASAYLLYRFIDSGQHIFGGRNTRDTLAFLVMSVSGLNLGLAGLLGNNIGMSMFSNSMLFMVAGALYIISAVYLYSRWITHGQKLF